jgi:lipopolysaccharide transport system permease protein
MQAFTQGIVYSMQHYIDLVWYKAYADLRVEASRGYLGILWWVLEPLLFMGVFYIVFGIRFQHSGKDYVAFLLVGLVAWRWFDNTIKLGSNALIWNMGLMQQVYVPKIIFPTITVVTNTVKFLFVLVTLLAFLLLNGDLPGATWLALPGLLAIQLLFIVASTWLISAIVPFLPDIRVIMDSGLTLLFFMSGIFFDIASVPAQLATYLRLNPMAILIESYRNVLIRGVWPDWGMLGLVVVLSVIILLVSLRLHLRYDRQFAKIDLVR